MSTETAAAEVTGKTGRRIWPTRQAIARAGRWLERVSDRIRPESPALPATDAGKGIRVWTAVVVVAVAAFAAVVSYSHIYDLAREHGQDGVSARLTPLSVDGLILAASLVLLHEARAGRGATFLARFALWLGIAATVAANVGYGLAFGIVGAIVSAWPALSFVLAVEMLMGLVRRARAVDVPLTRVARDAESAAMAAYLASVQGGNPLSGRQLETRFGMNRTQVAHIRATVDGSTA